MSVLLVVGDVARAAAWSGLCARLWPGASADEHATAIADMLRRGADAVCLLAVVGDETVGFAEASVRHEYVNGCETSPVAFLEGLFVRAEWRRRGIARALCAGVEGWGRDRGCAELGSDAEADNSDGVSFHAANGFEETERVVFFRKLL